VLGRPFAGNSLTFFGIPPIFFGILHGMHPSLFLRSLAQPTPRNAPEFRFHNFDAVSREPRSGFRVVSLELFLGLTMTPGEEYRQYAAECVRVARQIQNPHDKALLLDMALRWRELAEKVESESVRKT
jgi:hypothetical protein